MVHPTSNQIPIVNLKLVVKEKELSVAPESTVEYHIGVINSGTLEDIVSLSVKGIPSSWVSFDEDELNVAPGQAKQAVLRVTPPPFPDGRVGRYKLEIQGKGIISPSQILVAQSSVVVAAYIPTGRVGMMIGAIDFPVTPGSSISIPLLLENRGIKEDSFRLSINGIPKNWVSTTSTVTKLGPGKSQEILFTIQVPRTSAADAGRTRFKVQISSEEVPDQKTEIDCILTVSAFSKFTGVLRPNPIKANQPAQVVINNEGNIEDTFTIQFQDTSSRLLFEKITRYRKANSDPNNPEIGLAYSEIPAGEKLRIPLGKAGVLEFRSRLRSRPLVGNEQSYPFAVKVMSAGKKFTDYPSQVNEGAFLPPWVVSLFLIGVLFLCLIGFVSNNIANKNAEATEAAYYGLTQTALAIVSVDDSDGDGLLNQEEIELGTDPLNPDTDGDGLGDGDEVKIYKTNPLLADTDGDTLSDGDEVITYKSDPLNPDTDDDLLRDGDEIAQQTNPLIADTDEDGLKDGVEISLGTNPLKPDTDNDGLVDGQENQICPHPLKPDTDEDTIIDGKDLDPCDGNNPSQTATAIAGRPTDAPTQVPTQLSAPTETPVPTATDQVSPNVNGLIIFETNRDGNAEIYLLNAFDQSVTRITNKATVDTQPALAPNALEIAYVSNHDGNNEIYLTGVDRRTPVNLTNNAGDDQYPTWSPDGQWIAFTSNRDGNQEIYVMRSDGSDIHNITNNAANDFSPSWFSAPGLLNSQDWILFTSIRDGNNEVYKVKPDGSSLTNLTNNAANDHSPTGYVKGDLVAFVSDRNGNPEIYTMQTDGRSQTNLSNNAGQDLDPVFKPGGEWISFSTDRDGNFEIYIMQKNGTGAFNMTRSSGQDRHPDWR